jgi:hypothetical protein
MLKGGERSRRACLQSRAFISIALQCVKQLPKKLSTGGLLGKVVALGATIEFFVDQQKHGSFQADN